MTQATNNVRGTVIDDPANVGRAPGDDALVMVDGAETPITVKGRSLYTPHIGDRLLLNKVDSRVEIVQSLDLGALPYMERWRGSGLDIEIPPAQAVLDFGQVSDDSEGVTYTTDLVGGEFTIERSGKYIVTGMLTMSENTGAGYGYVARIFIQRAGEGFISVTYDMPIPDNTEDDNRITWAFSRKFGVGDMLWVVVDQTRGDPPIPSTAPETILPGRGKTNITLTWISD